MTKRSNIKNTEQVVRSTKPLITPDWTGTQGMTPFYDYERKMYVVAVSLKYETIGKNFQRAYPDEYVEAGVAQIAEYYTKALPRKGKVLDIVEILALGAAQEYYVPPRPRAKIKVLVGINEDTYDKMPANNAIDTTATHEITLNTKNLTQKIDGISNIFQDFHLKIKEYSGKIYGINMESEASDFKNIPYAIRSLVQDNGYEYNEVSSDLITIGINKDYVPTYAQINKGQKFENLVNKFGAFQKHPSIKNSQSIYYLSRIESIYGDYKNTPPITWEKFLEQYTIKDYRIDSEAVARKNTPQLGDPNEQAARDMDESSSLTPAELEAENKVSKSQAFNASMANKAEKAADNIENNVLNNIKKVENSMDGLESSFYGFFHQYQVVPLVNQAIICLDPEGEIARRYREIKKFLRDSARFVEGIIDILKIPTIEIPDFNITVNIMKDIGEQIVAAVWAALKSALLQLLRDILRMLVESCGNPDKMNFGGIPMKNLFSDPSVIGSLLTGPLADRALAATLDGVEHGITNIANFDLEVSKEAVKNIQGFLGNEAVQRLMNQGVFRPGGEMEQLISEVSAILTPGETAKLLLQGGTPEIRNTIKELVNESDRYPDSLKDFFSSEGKVSDYFKSAGKLLDEEQLLKKISDAQDIIPDKLQGLCNENPYGTLRMNLLMDKGLSADDAKKQIDDADQRKRKRLADLAALLEKDNLLDGVLPPTFCSIDENGNVVPGLIDMDHPSFTQMLKRTVDTSYDNVHATFNEDALGLVPALKQKFPNGFREIKRTKPKPDPFAVAAENITRLENDEPTLPFHIINPEFESYVGQGYKPRVDFPYPYIVKHGLRPRSIERGGQTVVQISPIETRQLSPDPDIEAQVQAIYGLSASILIPRNDQKMVPGLKENLKNLSLTGTVNKYYKYFENKLTLEQPNHLVQCFESYGSLTNGKDFRSTFEQQMANQGLEGFNLGPDSWVVQYSSLEPSAPDKESFNFTIFSDSPAAGGGVSVNMLYQDSTEQQLNKQAYDVILSQSLNSDIPSHSRKSRQERLFADFLDICFSNGSVIRPANDINTYHIEDGTGLRGILEEILQDQTEGLKSLYVEIFRDFFTTFSSEISQSDFFNEKELSLVNLTPRLSRAQIKAGCRDPHLLNLDEIKQIIINQYKLAKCVEKNIPNEDGLGTNKNNALESAVISGATIVTIRVYAIEALLKGIWAFSEFKFSRPEDIDQVLVEYIRNKMVGSGTVIGEIRQKGYADEFLLQCFRTYNRMAETNPNDNLEPFQKAEDALDYLIRIELYKSMQKMDIILGNDADNTIDSVVSDTFIPVFDVAASFDSNLTTVPRLSLREITILNEIGKYERYLHEHGLREEDLARREEWYKDNSRTNYGEIIYHLAKKGLPVNDSWGFGRFYDWTLRAHFDNLPLPDSLKQPTWAYKQNFSATPYASVIMNVSTSGNVGPSLSHAPLQEIFRINEVRMKENPQSSDTYLEKITPSLGNYLSESNIGRTDWPYKLENPLLDDNEWNSKGLNDKKLWYSGVSEFEYRSALTMFEIFNCPNVLMPGNAGASYSVPTGEAWVTSYGSSPMYEIFELPSAKKAYTPNSLYGPRGLFGPDPYSEPYHSDGNQRVSAEQMPSHYGHNINMHRSVSRMPRKTWTYRLLNQDELDIPRNDNFPQSQYLMEDMFHPKMMHYNLFDATIPSLPGDIQTEIDYYQNWTVWTDEQLYLNIKRQFWSNKTHWALSHSERKRLDKMGKDFLNGKWSDRPLPTVANLQRAIDEHSNRVDTMWKAGTLTFILDQLKNRIENLQNISPDYIPALYDTFSIVRPGTARATRPYERGTTPTRATQPDGTISATGTPRNTIGNWKTETDGWSSRPLFGNGYPTLLPSSAKHSYSIGARSFVSHVHIEDFINNRNKPFSQIFNEMMLLRGNNGNQPHYDPRFRDGNTTFSTTATSRFGTPEVAYLYAYHLLWEIDWWMSKLSAFYLLCPDFEGYRAINNYPDFLGQIKNAAQYVKEESYKDLDHRRARRQEILDELGRLKKMREPKGSPLTWFIDNGNIIYEKYIRVKEKNPQDLEEEMNEIDNTGVLYNTIRSILDSRDSSQKGVVNIDSFSEWLTNNFSSMNQRLADQKVDITIPATNILIEAVQTEAECGESLVFLTPKTESTVISKKIKISDMFEKISIGLRLTCVASPKENSPLRNKVISLSRDLVVSSAIIRDKAYLMNEVGTFTVYNTETKVDDTRSMNKSYVTIPFVSVEEEIGGDVNLADLVGTQLNAIEEEKYKLRVYHDRRSNQSLIDLITQTDEFKLFFKYFFPVDRMFSQNIMFIETFLASYDDVTGVFNNTKESLRIVFDAMLNSGNYKYEDELNNKDLAANHETPGVDLSKLALKFGAMIFKGLMETFDPNIAISKQIQFAANSGIRAANNFIGEAENLAEDVGLLDECETTIRIPDLPVLPISMAIFGSLLIPPTVPFGWIYDFSLGIDDWVENQGNSDVSDSRRCEKRIKGGRDYTKATECNTDPIDTSVYIENIDDDEEE
jgi:hypothetical protein